jgi:hypothetical protein
VSRLNLHPENHLVERIGWLRAAVLGASDGIISTASLIVGVAAAAATRTPAAITRSISARAISGLVRAMQYSIGTPARFSRDGLLVQLSGRNKRNASMTGTSPRASVSDTTVWQLAVLPSAEAYCAATLPNASLLRYRGVIDHQHGIAAPDKLIRLNQQLCFQRRCIPNPGGNEVMQLIVVSKHKLLRHRLNALAIARTDQA